MRRSAGSGTAGVSYAWPERSVMTDDATTSVEGETEVAANGITATYSLTEGERVLAF